MKAKFQFYEVVEIAPGRSAIAPAVGQRGAILGMAQCDDARWVYAVQLFDTGICWSIEESELEATGTLMTRADFYDGESISVEVDPVSFEGRLKG